MPQHTGITKALVIRASTKFGTLSNQICSIVCQSGNAIGTTFDPNELVCQIDAVSTTNWNHGEIETSDDNAPSVVEKIMRCVFQFYWNFVCLRIAKGHAERDGYDTHIVCF